MSEAKPQDGSTVKGYRTLTAGDIECRRPVCGHAVQSPALMQTANKSGDQEAISVGGLTASSMNGETNDHP